METQEKENCEEFKKSFSYGKRNDLNFKFLAHMDEKRALGFFEGLLKQVGDCLNDGEWQRITDYVIRSQTEGYRGFARFSYEKGPFTPFEKDPKNGKIALLTSSGHFVDGDDPAPLGITGMTQEEAIRKIDDFLKDEPVLSRIPKEASPKELKVRHGGYDIGAALLDHNVTFPLEALKSLEEEGKIGSLSREAYSFVGACSQLRLRKYKGPQWAEMMKEQRIEAVLLVPV